MSRDAFLARMALVSPINLVYHGTVMGDSRSLSQSYTILHDIAIHQYHRTCILGLQTERDDCCG
jgi:hypothetical protein